MKAPHTSIGEVLAPLLQPGVSRSSQLELRDGGIVRFVFTGPTGGAEAIRIGIFAGIHGDEIATASGVVKFLELLELAPELARDFCLFIYPVCNPTGFGEGTRLSRSGKDLNREFWRGSTEPEVVSLEQELREIHFGGIVSLHADDTSHGVYGFVDGATLTSTLLEPALRAAELFLPRNQQAMIDGFSAENGIIRDCYQGILSAPPETKPRPFELIFETPQLAPVALQEQAIVVALLSILAEYRKTISYAADL